MLRFPLRLTANLARARIAQTFRSEAASPIFVIHPVENACNSSPESTARAVDTKPGTELLATVRKSSAPVVWIGGAEPLLHPEMGQLTRCIAGVGRHVFLDSDATLLRRRIHEFRPVSRLFLTVQLDGTEESHDLRAGRPGTFRTAVEGIRAARLSGFLICLHARVDAQTDMADIAKLIQFGCTLEVDGFLISPATAISQLANVDSEALHAKTAAARKLIGHIWWESFSRIVEAALHPSTRTTASVEVARPGVRDQTDADEEGVKVA
jgi:sulfatase maturation enzyme AslB (radical SAM superfamily)